MLFWLWPSQRLRPELRKISWDYGNLLQPPRMEEPFEHAQEFAVELRSLLGKSGEKEHILAEQEAAV